jgi:hypothetical protein
MTSIQKKIVNYLLDNNTKEELVNMDYRDMYDICKLYGVVYVSQIWDLTDILFNEYRIRMEQVQQEIYNIE